METKKPVYDQSKEALIEVIEKGKKHYKVVPLPVGDKGNLEEIRPEEAILQVLTIEERLEKLELKNKSYRRHLPQMMEKKILSFANLRLEGLYEAAKLQENCEKVIKVIKTGIF